MKLELHDSESRLASTSGTVHYRSVSVHRLVRRLRAEADTEKLRGSRRLHWQRSMTRKCSGTLSTSAEVCLRTYQHCAYCYDCWRYLAVDLRACLIPTAEEPHLQATPSAGAVPQRGPGRTAATTESSARHWPHGAFFRAKVPSRSFKVKLYAKAVGCESFLMLSRRQVRGRL